MGHPISFDPSPYGHDMSWLEKPSCVMSSNMASPARSTHHEWFDDFPSELNLPFLSCFSLATFDYQRYILWIEEILHQLVDGLSHDNPTVHSVSWLPNGYQLVQDFFHPPYVYDVFTLDSTISIRYDIYIYGIYDILEYYICIFCDVYIYIYTHTLYIYIYTKLYIYTYNNVCTFSWCDILDTSFMDIFGIFYGIFVFRFLFSSAASEFIAPGVKISASGNASRVGKPPSSHPGKMEKITNSLR